MAYETTASRNKNPFLPSFLPEFLRGSGAIVAEAPLFGCGYTALGFKTLIFMPRGVACGMVIH